MRRTLSKTVFILAAIILAVVAFVYSYVVNRGWLSIDSIYKNPFFDEVLDNEFSVHFIDVGQGDGIYVKYMDFDILIDSGDSESRKHLLEYLKNCGVDDFEIVVASHTDRDHIGNMPYVIEKYGIELFWLYTEGVSENSDYSNLMMDSLRNHGVTVMSPSPGDRIEYGEMCVEVLSPLKTYSNDNDNSIVVKISYKDTDFLFMGDSSYTVERDLLENGSDISADVIKIAHHGSSSSTHSKFLEAVAPAAAVISVGDNSYGLPTQEVLAKLSELGIPYYRTDLYGDIAVVSDGENLTILTSKSA